MKNLISKLSFDHYLPDKESGCHGTHTIITTTEYYPSKKIKLKKQEETAVEAGKNCPCGTWKYYDENGRLTRKEKHESCNDGKLSCSE